MKRFRHVVALAGLLSLTLVAAACGGSEPTDADSDPPADDPSEAESPAEGDEALHDAAVEAGEEVVFYCAIDELTCDALGQAFTERYPGIDVLVTRIVSSQMTARYQAERESRAPTADFLMTSDYPFVLDAVEQGLLMEWGDMLPDDYPENYIAAGTGSPFTVAINGTAYNTQRVSPDEVPSSYEDLQDPKWQGRMCAASPAVSPTVAVMWGTMSDTLGGEDFLEAMGEMDISWYEGGNAPTTAALGAGECDLQVLANVGHVLEVNKEGGNLEMLYLDGVSGAPFTWGLNSESPNPNAQRLFAQWIASPDANELLVELVPATATAYADGDAPNATPPNFEYYEADTGARVLELLQVEL